MKSWEKAVDQFLIEWKDRKEIIGVMVCGSFITGNPTKRSDLDIHMILSEEVNWRERGNRIIDGYLIEYFANPPAQIRNYFAEDYNDRRTMSMIQFITGKVIFDHTGMIGRLKEEAIAWKEKKFKEFSANQLQLRQYGVWDLCDNLLDCYEENKADFHFVYHNFLAELFNAYCLFLNLEKIPDYQIYRYLTDEAYLRKYLKAPFPDKHFTKLFIRAMESSNREVMMRLYKILTDYILDESGGFSIDGWRLQSDLS